MPQLDRKETQKPVDYFLTAIRQAKRGTPPSLQMTEGLALANLSTPVRDHRSLFERMEGRNIISDTEYTSRNLMFLWKEQGLSSFERKVKAKRSNRAEDQIAKLLIGIMLVHHMRNEDICDYGRGKLERMTRQRPDLVLQSLEDLAAIDQFPYGDKVRIQRALILNTLPRRQTSP